jgi:hypothetical protein
MTCLKNNQIGNEGLSRVIANYERPVYKKIGINFNGTLSCPLLLVIVTAVLYIASWLDALHTMFPFIATFISGHLSREM